MARFSDVFFDATKESCKIPKEKYLPQGLYPIIDQGQGDIAGYTNNSDGLYKEVPAVIFGDHTRIIKYVDTPFFLGADGVKLLKAKDPAANYKYLFYALCAAKIPDTGYNRHFKWLKELDIPLPSPDEQRRIVSILDKVTSLIALRKQQLALLDELVKARFVEMFGDPVQNTKHFPTVKMGEACYLKAGITTSADEIHDYSDKYSVPCYGGNGIRGYVKSHTYEGTFPLIGRQGALCGNVQLATGKFHATEHAILVTPLKGQNSIWLYYLLKYFDLNRFQTGAAQPGLAVKALNQIEILTANVPVQNKFSDIAIEAYQWGLTIRQNLDTLEILKKALIQEFLQ